MAACEQCWRDANERALLLGGSVSDHYRALLDERRDNPCEQPAEEPPSMDARFTPMDEGKATGSATDPLPLSALRGDETP
jgi:hypothetical protein